MWRTPDNMYKTPLIPMGFRTTVNAMYAFCVCCRAAKLGMLRSCMFYYVIAYVGQPLFCSILAFFLYRR